MATNDRFDVTRSGLDDARFLLYLPRTVATWGDAGPVRRIDGTLVFADVTGFTALTERLSAAGNIGSEQITEAVNAVFSEILSVARLEGGDLLSFGGDAVLLLFEGPDHRRRAVTAAWEMQESMPDGGDLRASIGVASGEIVLAGVGSSQHLVFALGPVVDDVVSVETAAEAGEVVIAESVLAGIDEWCRGPAKGTGYLLEEPPEPSDFDIDADAVEHIPSDLAGYLPAALHSELAVTGAEAEHRPAVVAFLKIKGITAIGSSDSLAETLGRMVDVLVTEAAEHRVCVLASDIDDYGAKVVITAGVPHAVPEPHERLVRTVQRTLERFPDLDLRVGIADGPVFAGDLGAAFRRSYTVMGDPVNLAARLASVAGRAEVLVAPPVAEQLTGRFELEDRPPVALKGKALPVAPSAVGVSLDHSGAAAVSAPFVGRHDELRWLHDVAEQAAGGDSRIVELVGPAGIGKSRLIDELTAALPDMAHIGVRSQEYDRSTAYRTIGTLVRRSCGISLEATAEEAGRRLAEIVGHLAPDLTPWLPLIALAAEASAEPTPESTDLDPRFVTVTTARVLVELAEAMLDRPVLVAVDNHEWVDPASRDVLEAMIERSAGLRWIWVMAGRSPGGWKDAHSVSLEPLDREATWELIASVAPRLPPRALELLTDRAGGNPLFAIELAALGEVEAVPDTIERLLAARIDRLEARERRLLRYASVLGTEFDLDLLAEALAPVAGGFDDSGTWAALSEFITVSPLGKVRFTQGLIRDVAYAGLPYRRRREIHGMVAETIERRARHRAKRFAAVLSLHFEAAGNLAKTWEYATVAGERAAATWATHEALALYGRAVEAARSLGSAIDPDAACDAALALARAADLTGDFDEVDHALEFARTLSGAGRNRELAVASARLAEKQGELDSAAAMLVDAVEGDVDELIEFQAVMMLAGIRHRQGRFEESATHCRTVVDAAGVEDHPAVQAHALNLLSLNAAHLGDPNGRTHAERALELLEALGDWAATGRVLNNLAIQSYFAGRWDEATDLYRQGRKASDRAGDVVMVATFDNNIAEILSDQGHFDEAAELFGRAATIWSSTGYSVGEALVTSNRGRLAVRLGDLTGAREMIDSALDRFREMGAAALTFETETRMVELAICEGDATGAIEVLDRLDAEADHANPILLRLRAHALAIAADDRAVDVFEAACRALAEQGPAYENALALKGLAALTGGESKPADIVLDGLGAQAAFVLPVNRSTGQQVDR